LQFLLPESSRELRRKQRRSTPLLATKDVMILLLLAEAILAEVVFAEVVFAGVVFADVVFVRLQSPQNFLIFDTAPLRY